MILINWRKRPMQGKREKGIQECEWDESQRGQRENDYNQIIFEIIVLSLQKTIIRYHFNIQQPKILQPDYILKYYDKQQNIQIPTAMKPTSTPSKPKPNPPQVVPKLTPKDRLSQHDLAQLKSTFDLFDQDHGGTIDPTQIQKILQELGLDRRNNVVFGMISDLKSKNRPIGYEEFIDIIASRLGDTKSKDGLRKLYALYDVDNAGFIDFQKMRNVARQLGETMNDEEITEMMHNTHILNQTESNQFFTFDQFYEIVTKKKY